MINLTINHAIRAQQALAQSARYFVGEYLRHRRLKRMRGLAQHSLLLAKQFGVSCNELRRSIKADIDAACGKAVAA